MKNKTGYLEHIESLRGIAAMMVVCFHFMTYFNGEEFLVKNEKLRDWSVFGAQGVEMFYVISGFVIAFSLYRQDYNIQFYPKYILKRILRIVPNYWMTILFIPFVSWYLHTKIWGIEFNWDWPTMLASAFYVADLFPQLEWFNVIFVTLKVEIQFYFLIGLLFPLIRKNYVVRIVLFALWIALGIYFNNYQTVLINAPYFILGMTLYEIYQKAELRNNLILLFLIFALLYIFYHPVDLAIAILSAVFILWKQWWNRVLNFLGKISYSMYLLHGVSGGWLLYFLSRNKSLDLHPFTIVFLGILLSILVSLLFYVFIERPSMKLSKSIRYRK